MHSSWIPVSCVCVCVCVCARACLAAQFCLTLCDPMDYSPPGSSVRGILQVRILEWIAISFSRGSSWLREWTLVCRFFITAPPPDSLNGTSLHTQVPIQKWGHPWFLLPLIYSHPICPLSPFLSFHLNTCPLNLPTACHYLILCGSKPPAMVWSLSSFPLLQPSTSPSSHRRYRYLSEIQVWLWHFIRPLWIVSPQPPLPNTHTHTHTHTQRMLKS